MTDQTGQIVLGNSIMTATTAAVTSGTAATISGQTVSASTIGGYLTTAEIALASNNSAEAVKAREAITILREVTANGLISTAEAEATITALAILQSATTTLLSQGTAAEAAQAMIALQAANNVQTAVISGTAATTSSQSVIQTLLSGQTVQIVNGNLLVKDTTGAIISSNALLMDQTGKISLGNSLIGIQTGTIESGNATQSAIEDISSLNTSYSEAMLMALVEGSTIQNGSLSDILMKNTETVSLLNQIISLISTQAEAEAVAIAQAEADKIIVEAAAAKAAADKAAAAIAAEAAVAAAVAAAEAIAATTITPYSAALAAHPTYAEQWNLYRSIYRSMYGHEPPEEPVYQYATGGSFRGGLRIVGERGPELEYTGPSQIVNASKTESIINNNVILIAEVRALRAEIKAGNYQISKNTGKAARALDLVEQELSTDGLLTRTV